MRDGISYRIAHGMRVSPHDIPNSMSDRRSSKNAFSGNRGGIAASFRPHSLERGGGILHVPFFKVFFKMLFQDG